MKLAALAKSTKGRRDSGLKREQSVGWMSDATHRNVMETKSIVEDRGISFPKLEFPNFDGTNLENWIYRSERYFEI